MGWKGGDIESDVELLQNVTLIRDAQITPYLHRNSGFNNGRSLGKAHDAARRILKYLQKRLAPIPLEKDAVAVTLGSVLDSKYDWQHIREASEAFVEKLKLLTEAELTHTDATMNENVEVIGVPGITSRGKRSLGLSNVDGPHLYRSNMVRFPHE
jgi:hypothetical protein